LIVKVLIKESYPINMSQINYEVLLDSEVDQAAVLSPAEFKRLKREAAYGRNGLRNLAIIWFSFGSALRVTEIARLQIKDVVNVDGSLKEQFRLPAAYTKNGESRWAYILESEHKEALVCYLDWRVEKKRRLGDPDKYMGLRPDSPLFLSRGVSGFTFVVKTYEKADGTLAEYPVCSSLQQLISSLVKTTGVKTASSHSGRRSFATRLAERGIDLKPIQLLLGHKTEQQSLAYIDSDVTKGRTILKTIYGTF
jgi:integrase